MKLKAQCFIPTLKPDFLYAGRIFDMGAMDESNTNFEAITDHCVQTCRSILLSSRRGSSNFFSCRAILLCEFKLSDMTRNMHHRDLMLYSMTCGRAVISLVNLKYYNQLELKRSTPRGLDTAMRSGKQLSNTLRLKKG